MSTDDDSVRASYHLNRRKRTMRPKAPVQGEALFAEPPREVRRLVPLSGPECGGLFPAPGKQSRSLVPVEGWPDCRADCDGGAA